MKKLIALIVGCLLFAGPARAEVAGVDLPKTQFLVLCWALAQLPGWADVVHFNLTKNCDDDTARCSFLWLREAHKALVRHKR